MIELQFENTDVIFSDCVFFVAKVRVLIYNLWWRVEIGHVDFFLLTACDIFHNLRLKGSEIHGS